MSQIPYRDHAIVSGENYRCRRRADNTNRNKLERDYGKSSLSGKAPPLPDPAAEATSGSGFRCFAPAQTADFRGQVGNRESNSGIKYA